MVIGTRARHCQQVPFVQVGGKACTDGDFVARFAMAAGDRDFLERRSRMSIHQFDVVVAVVQRHPRVVAHPTVDGHEGSPAADRLDVLYAIERDSGPRSDRSAGFENDFWSREAVSGARVVESFVDDVGKAGQIQLGVSRYVRDPVATAEIEFR